MADPRWQELFAEQTLLADHVGEWQVDDAVPEGVADALRIARALLVDSYVMYEYSLVAVTWALLAMEATLRGCVPLDDGRTDKRTFGTLVGQAKRRGLITKAEAGVFLKTFDLRNKVVHGGFLAPSPPPQSYTPADVIEHLQALHDAISDIYQRAAQSGETGHRIVSGG